MNNIKYISFFIAIVFAVLIVGCASKEPRVKYPSWYSASINDGVYYYGVGEAKNKNSAKAIALNEIASFISTKISSNTNLQKLSSSSTKRDAYYEQSAAQSIDNEVKKIEFNDYEIVKTAILDNGNYIVQVRVNRAKTAKRIIDNINSQLSVYNKILSSNNNNILKKIKKINTALNKIDNNLLPQYYSAQVLDNTHKNTLKQIQSIKNKMQAIKSSITFSITSIKMDKGYKDYENVVAKYITNKGYKITNKKHSNMPQVFVYYDEKNIKAGSKFIFNLRLVMSIKYNGNTLYKDTITLAANSRSGYDVSRSFVVKKLKNKLEQLNLL